MHIEETIIKKVKLFSWLNDLYEKKCLKQQDKLRHEEFMREFEQAQLDLDAARHNYNFAKEGALLEYYIYEIKAAETRLDYYLQIAKKENIKNSRFFAGMLDGYREKGEGLT